MNPIDLPDVQSSPSTSNFKLTRVGVTGVKKLVQIKRPDKKTRPRGGLGTVVILLLQTCT